MLEDISTVELPVLVMVLLVKDGITLEVSLVAEGEEVTVVTGVSLIELVVLENVGAPVPIGIPVPLTSVLFPAGNGARL